MKKLITLLFLILGGYSEAQAAEQLKLDGGTIVYAYYTNDVPKQIQKDNCDKYVFSDEKFTPLKDGRYFIQENNLIVASIVVEDSCLFNLVGGAKLNDGKTVEFYTVNTFNDPGNAVFVITDRGYKRIYNKKMKLNNGQVFSVENGYIPAAFFDGENIVYENRD